MIDVTLEPRWSDVINFFDLDAWNLKAGLEAAFEVGLREQLL